MRLPDEFEENNGGVTPTVLSAVVAVTLFVGLVLVMVLLINNRDHRGNHTAKNETQESGEEQNKGAEYPDTNVLVSGSSLSPDDLDFWDKYPVKSEGGSVSRDEPAPKEDETPSENDPSTDGKHTMVKNKNGEEEWILINPYLPKHEYDFTKLVCQSELMKYYEDGRQISYVGADISKYQNYIDFYKVKKAGIDFVMIRVGARGYGSGQLVLDDFFVDNMKRAADAGLQIGVYFSSQAITTDEATEEAELVLEALEDYQITYPVAFQMSFVDNDTARIDSLSKSEKTEIAKTFLDAVAEDGYKTMLYGDKEWLIKEIDMSKLTAYDVWLSQFQDVPDYPYRFTMWQYTSSASIDGIAGYVNMNVSFIDYSEK